MAGGKMICEGEGCGKDISMVGAPLCDMCDPDIEAILEMKVKQKTPRLCGACFNKHTQSHCPNCKALGFDGMTCRECGHQIQIGPGSMGYEAGT